MSKTNNLTDFLTDVADAIRTKKDYPSTQKIDPQIFPSEIASIDMRNPQSKTVTPSTSKQVVTPTSPYNCLSEVTVNAISSTKSAQTYTPTTTNQTIPSGRWLAGDQTIRGDSNLVPSNIKSGVSIFGVNGTFFNDTLTGYFASAPFSSNKLTISQVSNSTSKVYVSYGMPGTSWSVGSVALSSNEDVTLTLPSGYPVVELTLSVSRTIDSKGYWEVQIGPITVGAPDSSEFLSGSSSVEAQVVIYNGKIYLYKL